jgi:GDP-L-fucose synthase
MTKVYVAGHQGMVGSAITRQLEGQDLHLITATRKELDLTNQIQVKDFFAHHKFDQVYLAAAKVGGIHANKTYPADFIYQNLMIQNNIIHTAHLNNVEKLLFLGSSCIYPKLSLQPMLEDSLLSGYLEPTNEPYAIAKIAGIKLCESYNRQFNRDYRSVMPTNLYGPNDNFNESDSHVLPSLIRKFHEAKSNNYPSVTLWGSGKPFREFLHVDDMAEASVYIMNLDKEAYKENTQQMMSHINVGSGDDCTIEEVAKVIADITKFTGEILWDTSMPDGTHRKLMDVSRLEKLGWSSKISLEDGLKLTYKWFLQNKKNIRK